MWGLPLPRGSSTRSHLFIVRELGHMKRAHFHNVASGSEFPSMTSTADFARPVLKVDVLTPSVDGNAMNSLAALNRLYDALYQHEAGCCTALLRISALEDIRGIGHGVTAGRLVTGDLVDRTRPLIEVISCASKEFILLVDLCGNVDAGCRSLTPRVALSAGEVEGPGWDHGPERVGLVHATRSLKRCRVLKPRIVLCASYLEIAHQRLVSYAPGAASLGITSRIVSLLACRPDIA
jgi:hypothetical protein